MNEVLHSSAADDVAFLVAGGEMGALIREHDWSASLLGTIGTWPQSLRVSLGICLGARTPTGIYWGEQQLLLYNDAFRQLIGDKHPRVLGRPAREAFPEIWDTVGPILAGVLAEGVAAGMEAALLPLTVDGKLENRWFDFTANPIFGDGGRVEGIFNITVEATDRVRSERARLQSERRLREVVQAAGLSSDFRALFEAAPTPLLVLAPPDWTIVAANDARLEVTGTTREGVIGRRLFDAFPDDPDDPNATGVQNLSASLRRVMATKTTDVMAVQRYAVRDPSGRFVERWWSPMNTPVLGTDGEVALVIHRVEEVTDLVRLQGEAIASDQLTRDQQAVIDRLRITEAALRESETRYRQIVEGAEDFAIVTLDEQGGIRSWNSGAARITGFTEQEAVGQSGSIFFIPEDRASGVPEDEMSRATTDGRAMDERWHQCKDGGRFWGSGLMMRMDQPGGGFLKIFRDRTSEYEAEVTLRQNEARFRLMADAAPQIMWVTDAEGRAEFFNKQWSDYTGVPYEPTTAADVAANHVHPEDAAATVAAFDEARRTGTTFLVEHRIRSAAGDYRWFLVRAEPYRDPKTGEIVRWFGASVDIHDRRQAEAELRESEERFRAIVDTATDYAIFTTDADGLIETWPKGAQKVFGWSAEEAVGKPVDMTFTSEDRALGIPETERITAQAAGQAPNVRWHLCRDGSRVFIEGITRPLHDKDGAVTGFVMVGQDVTERRAVDAALRTSEARFQALVNSIDQMVWSTRPDGHHDYYNQRWYDFTGVPEGSTNGEAWSGVFHPEDQERAWDAWRHSLATGEPYRIEYRLRHHSGQYRWVLGRAQAMRDEAGQISRWYGTCTDIEEIVQAREVLARSREELAREVAERTAERDQVWYSSHDLMLVARFDATIVAINPAWTGVLGWDEAELLGRSFVDLIHPDDVAASLAEVERLTVEGRTTMQFENRYRRKDGSWVWLSWAVSSHEGRFYGVARNVTPDKERQAELALAQEALRQSQKMEAMGQLTGGVAHDFNNLLTPIIGTLDRLVTRGVGSERERRSLTGALESAERAKTLVQRLLAFARRQPLQPVAVDVATLVTGMADLIGATLGPTISVQVDLAADLPPAKADPNQLEMALLNLAVNARDAMPDGGTLTLAASRESVQGRHRSGVRQGHYVRLVVSDTGTGMDAATLARAVEPFFSTKGIGKGTGLGLSMVHGLAAQLGGALTIQSQLGQGTTIELWLPISAEPIDEAEVDPAAPEEAVASRGRALLVDDEDLVRMSTADMLEDLGFDVLEAGSAEDALRLLHEGAAVDLLVTDHLMPGMSGVELVRAVRALMPDLPVLVVSGYAEVEGLAPDLPRLVKPFRAAELAERLAAMVPTSSQGK